MFINTCRCIGTYKTWHNAVTELRKTAVFIFYKSIAVYVSIVYCLMSNILEIYVVNWFVTWWEDQIYMQLKFSSKNHYTNIWFITLLSQKTKNKSNLGIASWHQSLFFIQILTRESFGNIFSFLIIKYHAIVVNLILWTITEHIMPNIHKRVTILRLDNYCHWIESLFNVY